jgi:ribosome-binding protein aMBF1 (putative translation factor)
MNSHGTAIMTNVDRVRYLEAELREAKLTTARALREAREAAGLSLRDVSPRVRLSAPTLSLVERGIVWNTKTVTRVAKVYATLGGTPA